MRLRALSLAFALVLATPGAASAAEKGKAKPVPKPVAKQAQAQTQTGPEAALIAVRDAQTGELRAPTAEEYRRLMGLDTMRAAPRSAEIVVNPDGSKTARLTGYESYEIAKKRPDGTVDRRCFADPVAAGIFLRGGDPSQPVAEK
jgi:hypothetical protein